MADDLVERLKEAGNRTMTAAEKFEQRVSFVYGQQDHDKPMRSKDEIRRAVADMMGYPLDAIESLRAENARLTEERDALAEASAYLIDRLTKVSGGIVVRDLEEARGSYDAALAKVKGGRDAR